MAEFENDKLYDKLRKCHLTIKDMVTLKKTLSSTHEKCKAQNENLFKENGRLKGNYARDDERKFQVWIYRERMRRILHGICGRRRRQDKVCFADFL